MTDKSDLIATDASAALIHVPPPPELAGSELKVKILLDAAALERAASNDGDVELLGQGRRLDAIRLAIGIDAPGYNVFVSGLRSRPERESVLRLLRERAATMPTPGDWVYVNNFRNPESPVAIYLQPGQGVELRAKMTELVAFVLEQLPKAFRREDFDQERAALRDKYNKRAQELFGNLETRARERGFAARMITPSVEDLKHHFNNSAVDKYLDEVAEHMLGNLDRFREQPPEQGQGPRPPTIEEARWFDYQVNVMVDNSATRGAPVVLEDAPTYRNLFGTIERWIDPLGRSGTNFTRIIGGAVL